MKNKMIQGREATVSGSLCANPPQRSIEEGRRDLARLVGELLAEHWRSSRAGHSTGTTTCSAQNHRS